MVAECGDIGLGAAPDRRNTLTQASATGWPCESVILPLIAGAAGSTTSIPVTSAPFTTTGVAAAPSVV